MKKTVETVFTQSSASAAFDVARSAVPFLGITLAIIVRRQAIGRVAHDLRENRNRHESDYLPKTTGSISS
ncbi:hypothetical protein [Oceanimonas sp. MB9]|uniref:hypothetical protein n=1 Tax=Oceanimonas sp. MB9 TaxID=2588453 RepID=UPI0013F658DD|nr:hypothetical protein [Oceanimonas sp. MB9]